MSLFPSLFQPITINNLTLRNRIISTPCGKLTKEKALGGASLFIIGGGQVDDPRGSFGTTPYMFSKYQKEKTRDILDTARQGGAKVSLEIYHNGLYGIVPKDDFAWGPCDGVRDDGVRIKGLDEEEMERICNLYAETAVTARDFGFDMIMLHFAHGWLPAQFLSPLWNHRTDEYGGSLENRMRFPKRIIENVRAAVGKDFPIDMRISAHEWMPGGIAFSDVIQFIQEVEPLIDMVNVSSGLDIEHEANVKMASTFFEPHMLNVDWAGEIRESINIPVSVVGAIMNPYEAEDVIQSGKSDMVSLGRMLIADREWAKKAFEGRPNDIVPCIRCLYCYHISTNRMNVGCAVNPRYSKEEIIPVKFEKAEKRKRVIVVGGGPGGMKAALVADERGHDVTLVEKTDRLGGQLKCSDFETYKQDLRTYREYLLKQLMNSKVQVLLNTEATPSLIKELNPDVLFLAIGAKTTTPPIPGVEFARQAVDIYPEIDNLKGKIVVIGGGTIGSEVGLELAEKGNSVYLIEITDTLNAQGNMHYRIAIRQRMEACQSLTAITNCRVMEILADKVIVNQGGKRIEIAADHVLLATGLRPNNEMVHEYFGLTQETFLIGDCHRVANVKEAILSATLTAMNV